MCMLMCCQSWAQWWQHVDTVDAAYRTSSLNWTTLGTWKHCYGWTTQALPWLIGLFALFRWYFFIFHFLARPSPKIINLWSNEDWTFGSAITSSFWQGVWRASL